MQHDEDKCDEAYKHNDNIRFYYQLKEIPSLKALARSRIRLGLQMDGEIGEMNEFHERMQRFAWEYNQRLPPWSSMLFNENMVAYLNFH